MGRVWLQDQCGEIRKKDEEKTGRRSTGEGGIHESGKIRKEKLEEKTDETAVETQVERDIGVWEEKEEKN